jgi:putative transposase
MEYEGNNHSVFIMYYRLIFTIRDRRNIISEDISNKAKEMFENIGTTYNVTLCEWKYKPDYIDVLMKAEPNSELSKFVNVYKSASSRVIKKEFPTIIPMLWNDYFWSRSFFLMTCGEVSQTVVDEYLKTQYEIQKYKRRSSK